MIIRLPPGLRDIADVIGLDAALKLAQAKGGQRIAVPGRICDGHWLIEVMGREKAEELSRYLTDGNRIHLDVPFGPTHSGARRNALTYQMLDNGASANEVAAATGVTRRTVFRQKAKRDGSALPREDDDTGDRQPKLFPE